MHSLRFIFGLLLGVALTAGASAQAVFVWTGGGSNANWTNTANWSPAALPGTGDIVRFNANTSRDPTLSSTAQTIGSLEFLSGTDAEAVAGTATLTINGVAGAGITNSSGVAHTFAPGIALGGSQTWSTSGAGSNLTFNRPVGLGGNALTIDADTGTTVSVSTGSGDVISGTGAITKNGAGTLAFAGNVANTFSGGVTVNAGTVTFANNASFGTGTLTLAGGTVLSSGTGTRTLANDLAVTGDATIAGAASRHYVFSTNNITTSGGSLTIDNTSDSGVGSVGFTGSGFDFASSVVFADANGELRLLNTSGTQTFSGVISGDGVVHRNAAGGTTVLSGANTFTGGVVIDAGTISAGHDAALGTGLLNLSGGTLTAPASRTFANNITLTASSTIAAGDGVTFNFTSDTIGGTGGTLTLDNTDDSGLMAVALSGTDFSFARAITLADAFTELRLSNASGTQTFTGAITGAGTVVHNGAGTTLLNSSGSSFSGLTVSAGTVGAGANTALGGGAVSLNGGEVMASGAARTLPNAFVLTADSGITGSLNLTLTGGLTQTGGDHTLSITNTGATTFSTGALVLAESDQARTLTLDVAGTSGGLTISSAIQDGAGSGADGLAKAGDGTLTLSGANTFTGAVSVTGGTLKVQSATALGAGSAGTTVGSGATLQLDGGVTTSNGTLTLGSGSTLVGSGGSNRWSGNLALTGNATITNNYAAGSLDLGNDNVAYSRALSDPSGTPVTTHTLNLGSNTLTLGGGGVIFVNTAISGSGNLVVDMTNSSAITGNIGTTTDIVWLTANMNTAFTGTTTVKNGTLGIATLFNTYPNDPLHPNFFGINGPLVIGDGAGAAESAKVWIPSGSSFAEMMNYTTPVTLNSDGLFYLQNSQTIGSLTFNGGKVDLSTLGVLYLGGDVTVNAVAGQTAVIAGTGTSSLSLTAHQGPVPSPNADRIFNVVGGVGNTSDLTISAQINNGSITKNGAGTMTITGDNSGGYEGTTTINNGILAITHNNALGLADGTDAKGTTVNTGGTLQLSNNITVADENLTLNGTGFGNNGALQNLSGNNTWSGQITVNDARAQSDAGLLTLSGPMTIDTALNVRGAGNTTISGSIGGSTGALTKDGTGTLTLSGNNTYGGTTTINQGVVSLQSSSGLGATTAGTTVTASGAALELSGNITTAAEPLTLNGTGISGNGALRNASGTNTFGGQITLGSGSLITANSSTSLTMSGGIATSGNALTLGTTANNGNLTISGSVSGSGSLTKDGSGSATFSGASTTLGTVNMNAGSLAFNGTTTSLGAVHLNAGATSVGGSATVNSGAIDAAVGATLTIASGGAVVADYASGNTTFSGALAGNGTFEKSGAAILTFDQSFSAAGLTLQLDGGTLALANSANLTFGTIHITGDTILDFGNSTATSLTSATLIIDQGVHVTVQNWVSLSDAWYALTVFKQSPTNTPVVIDTPGSGAAGQINFDGFSSSWTTWVTPQGGQYFDHEIRPTPEPATYGALLLSGSLALLGLRRFRRQRKHLA